MLVFLEARSLRSLTCDLTKQNFIVFDLSIISLILTRAKLNAFVSRLEASLVTSEPARVVWSGVEWSGVECTVLVV